MSELRTDTITASDGTSPVTLTGQTAAKAWVNFDGTASGAASRDSFNISGMTDVNTGKYTASYVNSMSNGTYAFTTATVDTSTISRGGNTLNLRDGSSPETGNIKLEARYGANSTNSGGLGDQDFMFVTVMGDLA
mgnify:CR=1 FL=1